MRRTVARLGWAAAFLLLLLAPLLFATGAGEHSGFVLEVALVFGLLAASVIVSTVVVVSRLRSLTIGLGIEQLVRVHRYFGLVALGLVLAHTALVVAADPANIGLLDLAHAPPRARAATTATIAMVLLAGTAVLRRRVRLPYQMWRWLHLVLAVTAVAGTALHVILLRHLIRDATMGAWFAALTGGLVVVLVVRWCARPLLDGRNRYWIREVRPEPGGVSTLVLAPAGRRRAAGWRPLAFAPGQFAWLRLRRWALFTDHPFSIASGTRADGTVEFTVRRIGSYTRRLGRLRPGTTVYLDGPHGAFTVDHTRATGLVLLAGGVGITPMMSMLRTLADRGDQRPHRLLVSGRSPADLLFTDELDQLRRRLDLTVVPTITKPCRAGPGTPAASTPTCWTGCCPAGSAATSSTTSCAVPPRSSTGSWTRSPSSASRRTGCTPSSSTWSDPVREPVSGTTPVDVAAPVVSSQHAGALRGHPTGCEVWETIRTGPAARPRCPSGSDRGPRP